MQIHTGKILKRLLKSSKFRTELVAQDMGISRTRIYAIMDHENSTFRLIDQFLKCINKDWQDFIKEVESVRKQAQEVSTE